MKLNYKKVMYVGLAFFIISVFWQVYDTIVPKILIDKFGMNQSMSGFVMALDNVLALFLLPLFGHLSDKTKTKIGKRKPYIIVGTLLAVVLFVSSSFADNAQLVKLEGIQNNNVIADSGILDTDSFKVDGLQVKEAMAEDGLSVEDFRSLSYEESPQMFDKYVKPARQAYAWRLTVESPATLIAFIMILLFLLLAMSVFRSPAVALMPDVTIKPLRSKGNAVINLMGSAGGITVLVLGILFKTGELTYMSYTGFFVAVAFVMLVALLIFILKVKEPQWSQQMEEDTQKLELEEDSGKADSRQAHTHTDSLAKTDKFSDEIIAAAQPVKGAEGTASDEKFSKPQTDSLSDEKLSKPQTNSLSDEKLSKPQMRSLMLVLASVFLWFTGYNAVTTKFSVYADRVLGLGYNLPLIIAQAAAIISFIPIGMIASRVGRRKSILTGIIILTATFAGAYFIEPSSGFVMYILFAFAGMGWATINVNSFPMVVELAKGGNVGRYTGYYYTASMAAQILTPILSGALMDIWGLKVLFPYGALFSALSFITMFLTRHGDNIPHEKKGLEAFDN